MSTTHLLRTWLVGLVCCVYPALASSYEVEPHAEMTEIAVSEGDLGKKYLANVQGDANSGTITFDTALEQLRRGSKEEDAAGRVVNHFHEPLSNSGLRAKLGRIGEIGAQPCPAGRKCLIGDFIGSPAPNYAFAGAPGITSILPMVGNKNSWTAARERLRRALVLSSARDRAMNARRMFEGLGHVVHLIQDQASPAHVRNDPHPGNDLFGLLADDPALDHEAATVNRVKAIGMGTAAQPAVRIDPDDALLQAPSALNAGNPGSNLFDVNSYTLASGCAQPSAQVGISEFVASHFVSNDTIPTGAPSDFPCPPLADILNGCGANGCFYTAPDGTGPILAVEQNAQTGELMYTLPVADENIEQLIPQAIGYTRESLDYFFRAVGKLEIKALKSGFLVTNRSNETLRQGDLELLYERRGRRRRLFRTAIRELIPPNRSIAVLSEDALADPARSGLSGGELVIGFRAAGVSLSEFRRFLSELNLLDPFPLVAVFSGAIGPSDAAAEPNGIASRVCKIRGRDSNCPVVP